MSRDEIVDRLLVRLGAPPRAPTVETLFNPALRRALALDSAATALLPEMRLPMAVDCAHNQLFRVSPRGTLLISPALLAEPAALGAVVRWAQETMFLQSAAGADPIRRARARAAAARHGAALLARLPASARELLRGFTSAAAAAPAASASPEGGELALPVEALLELGGDARIAGAPGGGMNRYGATSRPRPEAVHFSSSTASSVSDYAFAALDRLRRFLLLRALFDDEEGGDAAFADGLRAEILARLGLDAAEADVILVPSGTDAELVAVMFALAAGPSLANILMAPEESGRSVAVAAAGRAFSGGGEPLWPQADIAVSRVGVRDAAGRLCAQAEIERATEAALQAGLGVKPRALLHALIGSKTGVTAPSAAFVAALGAPSERIDVVADACQWRVPGQALGALVRAGWMVQISGSKFFTGPPFCGALVAPARMRTRRAAVARLWDEAPHVAPAAFWPSFWREGFEGPPASFGPLLRWSAALVEAELFDAVPIELARHAFAAFSTALRERLARCRHLVKWDAPEPIKTDSFAEIAGASIVCVAAQVETRGGELRRLGLAESDTLFRALNADMTGRLGALDPLQAALARQPFHIGQSVDLTPGSTPPNVVLRLVIGARFFSAIAATGERSDAALDAEIHDALRAVDKAELILARWGELT